MIRRAVSTEADIPRAGVGLAHTMPDILCARELSLLQLEVAFALTLAQFKSQELVSTAFYRHKRPDEKQIVSKP